jgi:hypothetical protein
MHLLAAIQSNAQKPGPRKSPVEHVKQELKSLPDTQPWDHTTDLKPGTPETMQSKNYPMSPTAGFIKDDPALFLFFLWPARSGGSWGPESPTECWCQHHHCLSSIL